MSEQDKKKYFRHSGSVMAAVVCRDVFKPQSLKHCLDFC